MGGGLLTASSTAILLKSRLLITVEPERERLPLGGCVLGSAIELARPRERWVSDAAPCGRTTNPDCVGDALPPILDGRRRGRTGEEEVTMDAPCHVCLMQGGEGGLEGQLQVGTQKVKLRQRAL